MEPIIIGPEDVSSLATRLERLDVVREHDGPDYREAEYLAQSLAELEESFRRYLNLLLPRLVQDDLSNKDLAVALHDIGEEFRHVLYHIKDPKYFRYLPDREDLPE